MSEKKTVVGTGGELLMHQLVAQGVDYAFTNTGSAEAGFFDAFLTVKGVQPILLLNEALVLSAADGYAKAAKKPAFVNVHLAAGTRQGTGQLFNSYFDGTPMVVTAALRDNGSFGDHNPLGAQAGFSQMSTVQDVTKNRWEVTDPRGIPMATRRAFKEAMSMPSGPVYVAYDGLALDAKNVEALIETAKPLELAMAPQLSSLEAMHDALLNAKKPLMLAGPDIHAAKAHEEVLQLAEHYSLPVAHNMFDYSAFPLRHPNYVGPIDLMDDKGYDVVITVGYRQSTRAGAGDHRFKDAGTIIAIGHDPNLIGNTHNVDIGVVGNVRHSVAALNALWKPDHANLAHIQKRKQELAAQAKARATKMVERAAQLSSSKPIHPDFLGYTMGKCLAENTMLVSEAFRAADQLMPLGYAENEWDYVRTYGASLGYGPGSAVGAQLGAPDRPVTLGLGDGAVMYSSSAFWSMARYGLPILTVVFNNMQYQTVRANFAGWGGNMAAQNKYPETFLGDPEIDFVMLAKAQGIEGMRVDEPGDLEKALKRGSDAQAAGEPYLLDVRITNVGAGSDQSWYMPHKVGAAH